MWYNQHNQQKHCMMKIKKLKSIFSYDSQKPAVFCNLFHSSSSLNDIFYAHSSLLCSSQCMLCQRRLHAGFIFWFVFVFSLLPALQVCLLHLYFLTFIRVFCKIFTKYGLPENHENKARTHRIEKNPNAANVYCVNLNN